MTMYAVKRLCRELELDNDLNIKVQFDGVKGMTGCILVFESIEAARAVYGDDVQTFGLDLAEDS